MKMLLIAVLAMAIGFLVGCETSVSQNPVTAASIQTEIIRVYNTPSSVRVQYKVTNNSSKFLRGVKVEIIGLDSSGREVSFTDGIVEQLSPGESKRDWMPLEGGSEIKSVTLKVKQIYE